MRAASDFTLTVRKGRRSGNNLVVVYSYTDNTATEADLETKVGFIVGKKVGNSVTRHAVVRKMRHIMRDLVSQLDANRVVIRALPESATANSAQLRQAITTSLQKNRAFKTTSSAQNMLDTKDRDVNEE